MYEKWVHRHADINYFISDTDKAYAIKSFDLSPDKTYTITYGVNLTKPPSAGQRRAAKELVARKHGFDEKDNIILFNGAFDYLPNVNALNELINHIFSVT